MSECIVFSFAQSPFCESSSRTWGFYKKSSWHLSSFWFRVAVALTRAAAPAAGLLCPPSSLLLGVVGAGCGGLSRRGLCSRGCFGPRGAASGPRVGQGFSWMSHLGGFW